MTTPEIARRTVTFIRDGIDYEVTELIGTGAAPVAYSLHGGVDGVNGRYWRAVETVACPRCLAGGGRGCTKPNGDPTSAHAERIQRATRLDRVVRL